MISQNAAIILKIFSPFFFKAIYTFISFLQKNGIFIFLFMNYFWKN